MLLYQNFAMERCHSVGDAIKYGMNKLGYQNIRDNQRHAVEAYFAGKDVFLCSPTGSGKSFVFEIAPFVLDYKKHGQRDKTETVCLVVVPLISLMMDQVKILRQRGISAGYLGADSTPEQVKDVVNGQYNLVFASPESLLNSQRWIFRGNLRRILDAVFIDESHCVAKW